MRSTGLALMVAAIVLTATAACSGGESDERATPATTATVTPTPTRPPDVPLSTDDAMQVCAGKHAFADAPAFAGAGPHQLIVVGLGEIKQPWNFGQLAEIQLVGCATPVKGPVLDTCFYSGSAPYQDLVRGDVRIRLTEVRTGKAVATVKAAGDKKAKCKTVLYKYDLDDKVQYGSYDEEAIYNALRPYYMGKR